jgi:hypothetical protein
VFEGDAINDLLKDYFGYRANPGPADISARLRNAYDQSGPLRDAPHLKGLPRSMVPMQPQNFQHPSVDDLINMMFFGDRV